MILSTKERYYIALIFGLGVFVRLLMLPTTNIWFDEAFSYYMSELSFPELIHKIATDRGEPLYYLILKGFRVFFGDSEIAMASLSCLFSIFTPLVLFFLAEEICHKRPVSFLSMILGAMSTASLKLANYVRFYALLELEVALSYLFFFRALRKRKISFAHIAFSLLGVYTHTYFWFVLFSQGVIVLFFYRKELKVHVHGAGKMQNGSGFENLTEKKQSFLSAQIYQSQTHFLSSDKAPREHIQLKQFSIAFACVIGGFLPWIPVLFAQLHYPASNSLPRVDTLFEVVNVFALSFSMKIMEAGTFLPLVQWIGFLLFLVCPLFAIFIPSVWREIRLLWVPILFSLLIPILISYWASPVYRRGLYDTTINALSIILVARVLYLCPRYIRGAILVLLVLQAGNWIRWKYNWSISQTRTESIAEVKEAILTKKSLIVYTGLSQIEPFYYLRGHHAQYTTYLFPRTIPPFTGYFNPAWIAHVDIDKEIETLVTKAKEGKFERIIIFAQIAKEELMQQQVKKLLQCLDVQYRVVHRYHVTPSSFRSTFYDAVIIYDTKSL